MQHDLNIYTDVLESLNLDANTRKTREVAFLSEICKPGGPMEVALKFLKKPTVSLLLTFSQCVPNNVWHEIFRVWIFAIFPAIRKNTFPQIKITGNIFPAKIYSRVNIL